MRPKDIAALALCLALPLGVGALSGIATSSGLGSWYAGLAKPSFNPPSWLFGPVWTALYALMGVSLYRVWKAPPGRPRSRALGAFAVQLVLNAAWSFLFFAFRQPGLAFAEILLIDAAAAWWAWAAGRVERTAGALQVPYLMWLGFATALNGAIVVLN